MPWRGVSRWGGHSCRRESLGSPGAASSKVVGTALLLVGRPMLGRLARADLVGIAGTLAMVERPLDLVGGGGEKQLCKSHTRNMSVAAICVSNISDEVLIVSCQCAIYM